VVQPVVGEPTLLECNLRALAQRDPELAVRLCWPVRVDHVERPASGPPLRRGLPFAVPAAHVASTLIGVEPGSRVLLLGIGLGEQLDALLATDVSSLAAWDRDPYLLRLLLSERDLSRDLASGRLRLALGADLVDELDAPERAIPVWNPLAEQVYRAEVELVRSGVGTRPTPGVPFPGVASAGWPGSATARWSTICLLRTVAGTSAPVASMSMTYVPEVELSVSSRV